MDYKDYCWGQTPEDFWYKGKNKLIDDLMSKISCRRTKLKILNLGAGTGDDLKILNKYGDNYVVDIDKKALDCISKSLCVEKRLANACDLPYKDNFFDIVVSFDVFEHIEDDKGAVSEIYRVLRKNGVLLFIVPAFQFLFCGHDKAMGHKRRYDKKTLKKLLYDFKNVKLYYWNSFLFIPLATAKLAGKNSKPKLRYRKLPKTANDFLYLLLRIESECVKHDIPFPFGISIVGICNK